MPDYGHDLLFGVFLTPVNDPPQQSVQLTQLADRVGLDLATFQDHPYQPAFHDTWTLMSYLAARTERITLAPNVLNLPLRQPVVTARSAASLDLLTGGRIELGLGSGAFWDAIEAVGGRRLSPGQAVAALEEAISIIRAVWAADERGGVRVDGEHYRVVGAKRGPAPAHDIGIWIGAYKPRMLRLTGRSGDGWLPSLGYLPGGPGDLAGDERRDRRGRGLGRPGAPTRSAACSTSPADSPTPATDSSTDRPTSGPRSSPPWPSTTGPRASSSVPTTRTAIERFAAEVAPAVRELVAAERTAQVGASTRQ